MTCTQYVQEQALVTGLPFDVITQIQNECDHEDAKTLASTCKQFYLWYGKYITDDTPRSSRLVSYLLQKLSREECQERLSWLHHLLPCKKHITITHVRLAAMEEKKWHLVQEAFPNVHSLTYRGISKVQRTALAVAAEVVGTVALAIPILACAIATKSWRNPMLGLHTKLSKRCNVDQYLKKIAGVFPEIKEIKVIAESEERITDITPLSVFPQLETVRILQNNRYFALNPDFSFQRTIKTLQHETGVVAPCLDGYDELLLPPQLEVFTLTHAEGVSKELLQRIFRQCPQLKSLSIKTTVIADNAFNIAPVPHVEKLFIQTTGRRDRALGNIATAFPRLHTLALALSAADSAESLIPPISVTHVSIGCDSFVDCTPLIQRLPHLKRITYFIRYGELPRAASQAHLEIKRLGSKEIEAHFEKEHAVLRGMQYRYQSFYD